MRKLNIVKLSNLSKVLQLVRGLGYISFGSFKLYIKVN